MMILALLIVALSISVAMVVPISATLAIMAIVAIVSFIAVIGSPLISVSIILSDFTTFSRVRAEVRIARHGDSEICYMQCEKFVFTTHVHSSQNSFELQDVISLFCNTFDRSPSNLEASQMEIRTFLKVLFLFLCVSQASDTCFPTIAIQMDSRCFNDSSCPSGLCRVCMLTSCCDYLLLTDSWHDLVHLLRRPISSLNCKDTQLHRLHWRLHCMFLMNAFLHSLAHC